jgi:hypothetical protein
MTSYTQYVNRSTTQRSFNPIIDGKSSRNVTDFAPLDEPKPRMQITTASIIRQPSTQESRVFDHGEKKGVNKSYAAPAIPEVSESVHSHKRTIDFSTQTESRRHNPQVAEDDYNGANFRRAHSPKVAFTTNERTHAVRSNYIDVVDVNNGGNRSHSPGGTRRSDLYHEYSRASVKGAQLKMHQPPVKIYPSQRSNRIFEVPMEESLTNSQLSGKHYTRQLRPEATGSHHGGPILYKQNRDGDYLMAPGKYSQPRTYQENQTMSDYLPTERTNDKGAFQRLPQAYPQSPRKADRTIQKSVEFKLEKKDSEPSQPIKIFEPIPGSARNKSQAAPVEEPLAKASAPGAYSSRYLEIQKALEAVSSQLTAGQVTPAKLAEFEDLMKEQRNELQKIGKLEQDLKAIKSTVENLRTGGSVTIQTPSQGPSYSPNDWQAMFRNVAETDPKFENYRQKIEVLPIITRDSNNRPDDLKVIVQPFDQTEDPAFVEAIKEMRTSQNRPHMSSDTIQIQEAPGASNLVSNRYLDASGPFSFGGNAGRQVQGPPRHVQSTPYQAPVHIYGQSIPQTNYNRNSLFESHSIREVAQPTYHPPTYQPQTYQPPVYQQPTHHQSTFQPQIYGRQQPQATSQAPSQDSFFNF